MPSYRQIHKGPNIEEQKRRAEFYDGVVARTRIKLAAAGTPLQIKILEKRIQKYQKLAEKDWKMYELRKRAKEKRENQENDISFDSDL